MISMTNVQLFCGLGWGLLLTLPEPANAAPSKRPVIERNQNTQIFKNMCFYQTTKNQMPDNFEATIKELVSLRLYY